MSRAGAALLVPAVLAMFVAAAGFLPARAHAAEARCSDAGQRTAPADGSTLVAIGECWIERREYALAVPVLERAIDADSRMGRAELLLGIARYHVRDFEGAGRAIGRAAALGVEDAQLELYTGLLRLEQEDHEGAAEAFERARLRGAASVEPVASYYSGLAFEYDNRPQQARSAYERVVANSSAGHWSDSAARALARLGQHRPRVWTGFTGGFEYDDNVVLRGADVRLPANMNDGESDPRLVFETHTGFEFLRGLRWRAGAIGTYYGAFHQDLDDFDAHAPTAGLWFDYDVSETESARLRYDFGHVWIGGDSFLQSHTLSGSYGREWEGGGRSLLSATVFDHDFRYGLREVADANPDGTCPAGAAVCGPRGLSESRERDRDGLGIRIGGTHTIALPIEGAEAFGGYHYTRFSASGDDWDHSSHEFSVGGRMPTAFGAVLRADASFAWKPFRSPSSHPAPSALVRGRSYALGTSDRKDRVVRFTLALERALRERMSVAARYRFTDNRSNVDVFDYDRHVFGLYLTVRFDS